jgi:hypothetical protein
MHGSENASSTEQTPLLSGATPRRNEPPPSSPCSGHTASVPWFHHAVTLAFVFLSFLLCLAVAIVLTVHSYASPLLHADPALLAQRALVFEGPSHLNVLNYTSEGLWCEIAGAASIDASLALGLSSNRFTDRLVGWAVRRVGSVTVSTSTVNIYSSKRVHLAGLHLPDIILPLATKTPPPLANITLQILVQPARDSQELLDFVSQSWQTGFFEVQVDVSKVVVVGGKTSRHSWKNNVHVAKHDVRSIFRMAGKPGHIAPAFALLIT